MDGRTYATSWTWVSAKHGRTEAVGFSWIASLLPLDQHEASYHENQPNVASRSSSRYVYVILFLNYFVVLLILNEGSYLLQRIVAVGRAAAEGV